MTKPKKATASDPTVKAQLASLTLKNEQLTKKVETLEAENTAFRKQNVELANVIDNDLKAETKLRIMAMSNYKEADLENLKIEQLQQIEETLTMSRGDASTPYKSIRAGTASQVSTNLTVGSLYNKTREEILESGGEF